MRAERKVRLIVGFLLLLFVVGPLLSGGVDLLVDWIWFGVEGYRNIYLTILRSQITLSSLAGLGFMAIAAINLLIARGLSERRTFRVHGEVVEFPQFPLVDRFRSVFRWVIWIAVVVIGYLIGDWATTHWLDYQMARNAVTLGQSDPL